MQQRRLDRTVGVLLLGLAVLAAGPDVRCVGFVSVRACQSRVSGRTVFLRVVGPWPRCATDTAVAHRDLSAGIGRYIPGWLAVTKTAHRSSRSPVRPGSRIQVPMSCRFGTMA